MPEDRGPTVSRRLLLRYGAVVGATGLLAACAPSGPATSATGKPATSAGPVNLVIAQDNDVVTMDPMMTHTSTTFVILDNMYDALVRWGPNGKPAPRLAESWKQVDDKTFDFTLRSGVKFHNGELLDAAAVKYSFDRVLNADIVSPATAYFKRAGIKTQELSPSVVRITTSAPYSALLPSLMFAYIVPPKYLEQVGKAAFNQKPVGTGAYRFVEWVKDQRVILERNDDYWGAKPQVKQVTFRPIPEPAGRLAALLAGETDISTNIALDRFDDVQRDANSQLILREGFLLYLGLQQLKPPFNDKRVRQAVNYAVDVDSIINSLMRKQVTRVPGTFYPSTPGFDPGMKPYSYDPERARRLLAEAGFPNGFETDLYVAPNLTGTSKLKELAEATAEQLSKVGIKVNINVLEIAAFNQRLSQGTFPMYFYVWTGDPASGRFLETLFSSTTRGWYYKDPAADALIDQYFTMLDETRRTEVGLKLNQYLYEQAPWLFLFQFKNAYGVRKTVKWGADPRFDTAINVADITKG